MAGYQVLYYIGIGGFVLLFTLSIVLFFVLKIPKVFGEITGISAKKSIKKLEKEGLEENKKSSSIKSKGETEEIKAKRGFKTGRLTKSGKIITPVTSMLQGNQIVNNGIRMTEIYGNGGNNIDQTTMLSGENNIDQTTMLSGENNIDQTTMLSGENNIDQTTMLSGENNIDQTSLLMNDSGPNETNSTVQTENILLTNMSKNVSVNNDKICSEKVFEIFVKVLEINTNESIS